MGIVPTLPPAADAVVSHGLEGSAAGPIEAVPEVTREEAEQPLLTPEEVVANLSTSDTEVKEMSTKKGAENPTKRANKVTDRTAQEREVPTVAREEEIKRSTPKDEAAKARAATVHSYQRRPARVEDSKKKATEEPQNKAPEKKTEGVMRCKKEVLWNHHDAIEYSFWQMSQKK